MSERATRILLAAVVVLLTANLLNVGLRPAGAQPMGTLGKLPAHGVCVGIIAEGGVVFRAFADGTVEGYKVGGGRPDWRPIALLSQPVQKK